MKTQSVATVTLLIATTPAVAQSEMGAAVQGFVMSSTPMAIAFILSVTAMKISAFVIGYLIVRLGHDTLIKGVSGEVDFGFSGSGIDAKLKAASPGTFFVLAGAAIIMWGLFVDKPLNIGATPVTQQQQTTQDDENSEAATRFREDPQ